MKTNPDTKTLVIVGLGLLGASFADALRSHDFSGKIIGVSGEHTLAKAKDSGFFNEVYIYGEFEQYKSQADVILICLPLDQIDQYMRQLANHSAPLKVGAVISDVGSAKNQIQLLGMKLFDTGETCFVGGHPMAGSQKSGFEAHDPLLYESALWILTRPEAMVKSKASALLEFIEQVGAAIVFQEANEHDRRLARVSHLPQMLSSLLASTQRRDPEAIFFSGPGFRDMTRLAESSWPMWEGIVNHNSPQILGALKDFQMDLLKLINDLENKPGSIESLFREGAEMRAKVPVKSVRDRDNRVGILVTVPNKPGQVGAVVSPLAMAEINIVDIELLKNREGLGGTLRLSFTSIDEAQKAIIILSDLSISARLY